MNWVDRVPLSVFFIGTVLFVLLSIAGGFYLGQFRRKRAGGLKEGPVGSVVGALLSMLAFVLTITFGMTGSRFEMRKQILLNEVIALEKSYFRTGLIMDPYRSRCRQIIKEYVDLRASFKNDPKTIQSVIDKSQDLQSRLWREVLDLSQSSISPPILSLFINSVNDVIDLHTSRVTVGRQYRLANGIWGVLFLLTMITMAAVGYQFGLAGQNSIVIYSFLAFGLAVVITSIADLDSEARGKMVVNQRPMIELQKRLQTTQNLETIK